MYNFPQAPTSPQQQQLEQELKQQLSFLRRARWQGARAAAAVLLFVVLSFASLPVPWAEFFSPRAIADIGRFFAEFFPPELALPFLYKVAIASWETLAMSLLGTLLAAGLGLILALPASQPLGKHRQVLGTISRGVMSLMRSIPELVWAALLLIAAGLGPFAGTLALEAHTSGVLGRLFAEAFENAPSGPGDALRVQGVAAAPVLMFATLPQVLPQLASYTLYRWENNIRAAAVLGVVGAGGLGQMLSFHLSLFQMSKTATVVLAMLVLVVFADSCSGFLRRGLTRQSLARVPGC